MELIEREWLINMLGISKSCTDCQFSNGPDCYKYNCFVSACEAIYEAPVVDAVPVVRCKDCKHSEKSTIPYRDLWCEVNEIYMDLNYFCADGERRTK